MCTGVEIAAMVASAATTVSAVSNMNNKPAVSATNPAADAAKAADQAAQDAARMKLEQRRRSRANSLLSDYSGGEDQNKQTLGA